MARLSQAMLPAATRTSVTARGSERASRAGTDVHSRKGKSKHAQDDEQQRPLQARPARRS